MKLTEFIKLSPEENEEAKDIFLLLSEEKSNNCPRKKYKIITHMNEEILFKLAMQNKQIDELCKESLLSKHWEKLWRDSGTILSSKEYCPLKTVNCFDLLKGLYLFEQYRQLLSHQTSSKVELSVLKEYLTLSAEFGCFFALKTLCNEGVKLLQQGSTEPDLSQSIIYYAEVAAKLYWTAGYFLKATVLNTLTQFYSIHQIDKKTLLKEALTALYMAQKLEAFSEPMLNNAFQGKTLQQITNNVFQNWIQFKSLLQKNSGGLLQQSEIDFAQKKSKDKVSEIIKDYKLTFSEISEQRLCFSA